MQHLLAAAVQKFADAKLAANSGPTRLEAAYDAILFCALSVFAAQGYRVLASQGHHKAALEGLAAELKLSVGLFDEIELLLGIRNSKYTGFLAVKAADLDVAMKLAERVISETERWFKSAHPELLKPT